MGVARSSIRPSTEAIAAVVVAALGVAIVACVETIRPSVPVASVSVAPPSATVTVGGTTQLSAAVHDDRGNVLTERGLTWSSANPATATVSVTGLVTGAGVGQTTVVATSEGKNGTSTVVVASSPAPADVAVLLAAGDIANCGRDGDEKTAALLDTLDGIVAPLGDNAYENGTDADYANCYHPTWGRHKARTRPSPGNHEYQTPNATGYYNYFGSAAGEPGKGYYSYQAGQWHVIALNDEIDYQVGSPQESWLRADLAGHPNQCTLAYFHRPRFTSGVRGGQGRTALWQALYDAGADLILNSHDHLYERFAPQRPDGTADPQRGIRQFTVGTGGSGLYEFGTPVANSEVRNNTTYGVLKLTLRPGGYDWKFVPVSGQTFTDVGSGTCH